MLSFPRFIKSTPSTKLSWLLRPIPIFSFSFTNVNMSNSTSFDPANCTYATCSVAEYGQLTYIPSLPGNAFYLAIFAAAAIAQLVLGITYRTWSFTIGMLCGCALEILGYVARIQLHYNDFDNNHFIVYLVGLTIGPAFFSGSIYLCLARIIAVYGTGVCVLSPRTITVVFVCADFCSLVLQAAGGALTSLAISESLVQAGINIMIAGLALQVASTTVFCAVCLQIVARVFMRPESVRRDTAGLAVRQTGRFRYFLWGQSNHFTMCEPYTMLTDGRAQVLRLLPLPSWCAALSGLRS